MYNFILQIFILVSLGAIVFLVARTLPRISETETVGSEDKKRRDLFKNIPWEKLDVLINSFSEKTLRKTKLILMKLDNLVSRQLNKFKKDNGDNGNNLMP